MNQVIGEVLPLAVAVLISPIPIAAEILLLFSARPRPNALGYSIGFMAGVGIGLGILTAIAAATDLTGGGNEPSWAAWLRVVLGAAVALLGFRRFRDRPAPGEAEAPKWMDGIESFAPGRSFAVGLAIGTLNPKNNVVGLAAAASIASGLAGEPAGDKVIVVVAYAIFASLGVLAPLLVALVMGDRADSLLREWRTWLMDNNAAVVAVVFLVIGAVLVGKGIAAL